MDGSAVKSTCCQRTKFGYCQSHQSLQLSPAPRALTSSSEPLTHHTHNQINVLQTISGFLLISPITLSVIAHIKNISKFAYILRLFLY